MFVKPKQYKKNYLEQKNQIELIILIFTIHINEKQNIMESLDDIHPSRFMLDLQDNADYLFMRISGESEDDYKTYYDFDEAEYDAERDGVTLSSTGYEYYYKKEGEIYECLISMNSRKCLDINRYSEGQNEGNPNDQDDSLEIRGFVEALLESYSGDEDEVLYKMPWAEKYLIEIKNRKS